MAPSTAPGPAVRYGWNPRPNGTGPSSVLCAVVVTAQTLPADVVLHFEQQ